MVATSAIASIQKFFHDVLEGGQRKSPWAAAVTWGLLFLIVLNVVAFILETVEPIANRYGGLFDYILYLSIGIFTLEYALRVWACTLDDSGIYSHPLRGRIRYVLTPLSLIDLAVLLPFYVGGPIGLDLRFLRLFRLLWVLKITRYLPAMGDLGRVLKRERRTLAAIMTLMLIILFIASSLIFLFEHDRQPEQFASIPHAMWWGVSTLTTVGYGDVVPISLWGRVLGVVIMLLGIGTLALQAGVLASAFAEERKRRDFIQSWSLVAQVPCFASLSAQDIAGIASLLHPREVMAKEVLFFKGDEAHSMFFIVSGELEVELQPQPRRLTKGEFFGEVALVYHRRRTASVVALCHSELLELGAEDLNRLFENKPELKSRILEEAQRRLARDPIAPEGEPLTDSVGNTDPTARF